MKYIFRFLAFILAIALYVVSFVCGFLTALSSYVILSLAGLFISVALLGLVLFDPALVWKPVVFLMVIGVVISQLPYVAGFIIVNINEIRFMLLRYAKGNNLNEEQNYQ